MELLLLYGGLVSQRPEHVQLGHALRFEAVDLDELEVFIDGGGAALAHAIAHDGERAPVGVQ